MLLFFEVLCAYFAAVGVFFLVREAYYCLSEDKDKGYVCIYIAKEGEQESDARKILEDEDIGGRVIVIYGEDKQIEKKITDLCIKHGRIYIKK
ncbi:MAG: hypothetical protein A2Y15_01660 [Clostridiales bacterium GWF2_36_10]|nr:MAG: hypothetical protein A2Y15_01660 [Clostridiales bacterium GWF2_36_10]